MEEIEGVVEKVKEIIISKVKDVLYHQGRSIALMIQGEYTFCYTLLLKLKEELKEESSVFLAVPTTSREVVEEKLKDGSVKKTAVFKFIRWRFIPL